MFLSIISVTGDNKPAKYLEFNNEAEAVLHAGKYKGFVVADSGCDRRFWVIDPVTKVITEDSAEKKLVADAQLLSKRKKSYGTPEEQLDFIAKNGIGAFQAKRAQVDSDNPL